MTEQDHHIMRAAGSTARQRRATAADLCISPTRLHQRILQLLDDPDAEQAYPVVVHRWRRIGAQHRADRARKVA